jgi:tellurite resistance protein TerC
MNGIEYPFWVWIFFFAVVLIALGVDIFIVNRHAHVPTRKETVTWSIVWISLALSFNVFIYWIVSDLYGHAAGLFKAKQFFTGYLIELSLSVDNLFVFLLIFSYFKVPKKYQHRVLFWGIMGAILMRMGMIFLGAELVDRFHAILYVFGAFLIYTGLKMFSDDEAGFDPESSKMVKLITRYIPIVKRYEGEKFIIVENGKRVGTLLLLVLIVVEISDVVFAVDSIPAIFGITTDRFIVYTSNIFAILGLRTFFFLLADLADKFHYLKYGLATVLTFIGFKMLLPMFAAGLMLILGEDSQTGFAIFVKDYIKGEYKEEFMNISLGFVVTAITLSIVFSLLFPAKSKTEEEKLIEHIEEDIGGK